MLVHDVVQGSPEWFACRLGIPTASEFHKIITSTGKASIQSAAYSNRLLAEIMLGRRVDSFAGSSWTDRGTELERHAAGAYELQRDISTVQVGFCTDDEQTMGASPDRLVGQDGLLEIKCPAPHTHVKYLKSRQLLRKYYAQVQGQMLVTGRQWADLMSYHPEMPALVIRVVRDPEYLAALSNMLADFTQNLWEKQQRMISLGAKRVA